MGATDSKLAFRKSVFRLFEERNIAWDVDDFWSLFWTLPDSVNDIFSLVGASDIRRARDSARENVETLIDKILQQMDTCVHDFNSPSPQVSTQYLLNCCRVLTRILPFLFEQGDDDWQRTFFWTRQRLNKETRQQEHDQSGDEDQPLLPSRGDVLLSLTLRSLFLAGFTLPPAVKKEDTNVNYVIWETGIGCSTPIGSFRDNEAHRTEVLRLLLVLLSPSIYDPAALYLRRKTSTHVDAGCDRWIHSLVTTSEKKIVLALLCSLINTASNYNPSPWGRAAPSVVVFNDTREHLVVLCLRVLLLLLDTYSPASMAHLLEQQHSDYNNDDGDDYTIVEKEWMLAAEGNKFTYYLSKLHRAQDFQFLIDGFYRTLSHPMQGLNTYLPGKRTRCYFEMIMLCWKLLQINTRFRSYLMETERALDLTLVLIYHATENKLETSQLGLVRMCVYVLQTLSTDRRFGSKLNKPFQGYASLPSNIRPSSDASFAGSSYADFLILSIYNMIATSRGHLSILYPSLIITLTNLSPYLKHISPSAANKWVALFGSFAAPGFLLADETNPCLVQYFLEGFYNILRHQSSENGPLICSMVRNHIKFERLRDLDLDQAMQELAQKQNNVKQPRPSAPTSRTSSSASLSSIHPTNHDQVQQDDNEGTSEKALGKRREENQRIPPQRQTSSSSTLSLSSSHHAKHGFIPTQEWMLFWKKRWDALEPLLDMMDKVLPVIQKLGERQALDTLRTMDLSMNRKEITSLLRAVPWSEPVIVSCKSALWAHIYLSTAPAISPWQGTQIRLFHIKLSSTTSTD
ncbi:high-temperature-induced dauer-formation protein-domain-containing protein [Halteromyces radiatus]|uniref:high-temperature-induced dauer-formation protein-domain-containing protein n=1 Tax=Halteromyces radiatus TaxID=101107 RepID=UPI00221F9D07|nr:high-temperature-induced dauer-formation protein-domain-containing protein [Halteromyces radiatus]KAI8089131.1 high-temperature-induced dauer-formation protein-domain-containing protein [Halteromyces radiatus]